jgi:hypothetical protein
MELAVEPCSPTSSAALYQLHIPPRIHSHPVRAGGWCRFQRCTENRGRRRAFFLSPFSVYLQGARARQLPSVSVERSLATIVSSPPRRRPRHRRRRRLHFLRALGVLAVKTRLAIRLHLTGSTRPHAPTPPASCRDHREASFTEIPTRFSTTSPPFNLCFPDDPGVVSEISHPWGTHRDSRRLLPLIAIHHAQSTDLTHPPRPVHIGTIGTPRTIRQSCASAVTPPGLCIHLHYPISNPLHPPSPHPLPPPTTTARAWPLPYLPVSVIVSRFLKIPSPSLPTLPCPARVTHRTSRLCSTSPRLRTATLAHPSTCPFPLPGV